MVDGTLFENEVSQGFVVRGSISLGKVLMHCVREKIMEEGDSNRAILMVCENTHRMCFLWLHNMSKSACHI